MVRPALAEPDPYTMWPCDNGLYCRCAEILSSNSRGDCGEIQSFGIRKVSFNLYKDKILFQNNRVCF